MHPEYDNTPAVYSVQMYNSEENQLPSDTLHKHTYIVLFLNAAPVCQQKFDHIRMASHCCPQKRSEAVLQMSKRDTMDSAGALSEPHELMYMCGR